MGANRSNLEYEGYGRTYHEAAVNLGHMIQYHHDGATVHRDEKQEVGADGKARTVASYYAFDGRKHAVHFDKRYDRIRAYVED